MLGDMRVLMADPLESAEPELLLDTERVALQALFDMIRRFKVGYRVELHKRTLETALLSLIGPHADWVASATELGSDEHANLAVEPGGVAALAVRTDVGVDLLCDSALTPSADRGAASLPAPGLSARPPPSACASNADVRATASSSTRP